MAEQAKSRRTNAHEITEHLRTVLRMPGCSGSLTTAHISLSARAGQLLKNGIRAVGDRSTPSASTRAWQRQHQTAPPSNSSQRLAPAVHRLQCNRGYSLCDRPRGSYSLPSIEA